MISDKQTNKKAFKYWT